MKNIYKKIIIMFVMVLGIMGIGAISNGYVANAATVGDQLLEPEDGWKRIDDTDDNLKYIGSWILNKNNSSNISTSCYNKTYHGGQDSINFKFKGTKLRIISLATHTNRSENIQVKIDDINVGTYSERSTTPTAQILFFEKTGLENSIHSVEIINNTRDNYIDLDAIDIDADGEILSWVDKSISLDNSTLTLKEETSKNLIAATTPSSVNVVWGSSDENIANVDQTGKVTGVKEGTCTVTATIEGTDIKAECIVTVTKEDVVDPEPEEPTGDGNLFIEMVDGNIKQGQDLDVTNFIKWFKNRDLDKTENPIYKIKNAKGNVEYLVHDKVVGFEIR